MLQISEIINSTSVLKNELNSKILIKTMRRFLLIECQHNLNVLNLISKNVNQYSTVYLELFRQLESDKIEYFLINNKLQESVIKKVRDFIGNDEMDRLRENILENILLKIKMLNAISNIMPNRDIKKFKLKERSENLEKKILLLQTNLLASED